MARRRITALVFSPLAMSVAIASIAWACVATSGVYIELSPSRGQVGTVVTVNGGGDWDADQPVALKWYSGSQQYLQDLKSGIDVSDSGSFSTSVTIPNSQPAVYYVAAVQTTSEGKEIGSNRPFEIRTQSTSGGEQDKNQGGSTSGSTSGAESGTNSGSGQTSSSTSGGEAKQGSGQTSNSTSGEERRSGSGSTSTSASGAGSRSGSTDTSGTTSGGRHARAGGSVGSPLEPTAPAFSAPQAIRTDDGQVVFGDSVAPTARPKAEADGKTDAAPVFEPQRRGVWAPRQDAEGTPLLTDSSGDERPAVPGSHLMLVMALAGTGMVVMFGGFLVAEVRRRKARIQAPKD